MKSPLENVLLGTAVGDSLGLPAEGLTARRIARRWPGPWRQRFFLGRGMVSDDTEHTVFVAQSLARFDDDPRNFQRTLAWRLRFWLLCLPAGIGLATLRAILKLWLGFPPSRSGVFSAGNGPAMRSAVIGVFFADDPARLRAFVQASTRLTHTDPKAEIGALAVAMTAAFAVSSPLSSRNDRAEIGALWKSAGADDSDWQQLIDHIFSAHEQNLSVQDFARIIGCKSGVSGYVYQTVPVALYAWLHHFGDFRASIESVLTCGGDTDTVGAITGALAALNAPIPLEWIENLGDYPISSAYLADLASALETVQHGGGLPMPPFHWFALPLRNLIFLVIVLAHAFRRLIPL
ncbi:hypothetical protein DB345_09930 [Spartobacteria bacterium LR76]|nr:hypothetical protein DB345_09930 [Spartobacteria bacterium LR76]